MFSTSAAATIQEATREDLDAGSISSLTTVQASNRVSREDRTMANVSHNDNELDVGTYSYHSAEPSSTTIRDPFAVPPQQDPAEPPPPPPQPAVPPPPGQVAVNLEEPNDEYSGLTVSEVDEPPLDADLQAQREAAVAEYEATVANLRAQQLRRTRAERFKRNKQQLNEHEQEKRRRTDKRDDGGGGGGGGGGEEDLKPAAVN